jgi:glutamine amidotransferase
MSSEVSIIDYGVGNVQAFVNMYREIGIPCQIASSPGEIDHATRLILPGVGAFDWTLKRLEAAQLRPALETAVRQRGIPILGVCVGMQMMGQDSEEGQATGLQWFDAQTVRFATEGPSGTRMLPHMGWNSVTVGNHPIFQDLTDPRFYFLHSYHVVCKDEASVIARADYDGDFTCAMAHQNICGVQFHPEKSHTWGKQVLANFGEWTGC